MSNHRFAERMSNLTASATREILKITERPEFISFAGGLPAPEHFPVEELSEITSQLLAEEGSRALQYAPTEGYRPLRAWIADHMNAEWSTRVGVDDILITSGSQQGLDLTAKLFLDQGDCVICESPTYLAAISAFKIFRPRFVDVPADEEGMDLDILEKRLSIERPKLIYVVPNSQNPSGRTWSIERRREFMAIATRYEVPVVEDNAYGDILLDVSSLPSLKAFDSTGGVVVLGTFSKIYCPGLRVGWLAASQPMYEKYVILKQAADIHTSIFVQMITARYLASGRFEPRLERIRQTYRERRDAMLKALDEEMPPGVRYTRPAGGMFVWLDLPEGIDVRPLFQRCLEQKVAFVPGSPFFPAGGHHRTMRLSYSSMPPDRIREGVRRLAAAIREMMAEGKAERVALGA